MPGLHAPAIVRLLRRVDRIPDSGCWVWGGFTNPEGYCVLSNDEGVLVRGHRLAYEFLLSTEIPDGLVLDHTCRVRACVNPEHLEPVTPKENVERARPYMRRATCKNGHLLEGDNLLQGALRRGRRICRICNRRRSREWMRAKRAVDAEILEPGDE